MFSRDLTLRLWQSGKSQCYATPHQHSIKCLAADLAGRYIATGSYDGQLIVLVMTDGKLQTRLL